MTFTNEANFTCACLLVINEIFRSRPDVRYTVFQNSKTNVTKAEQTTHALAVQGEDSDEEVFQDVDRLEEETKRVETTINKQITQTMQENPYDPLKREPKYARAQSAPLWELVQLARHCHPTVSQWATDLLKGELLEYPGDPLLDFGLGNFLDRITYKNPKSEDKI